MMKIVLASGNRGKLAELQAMLAPLPNEVPAGSPLAPELPAPEPVAPAEPAAPAASLSDIAFSA